MPIRYVQRFRDRHGAVRHYFRRAGFPRVALPGLPGSAAFAAAYEGALASAPREIGAGRAAPGSVAALLMAYYGAAEWKQLDPDTRRTYRLILERFREAYGDLPAAAFQARHMRQILDGMADRPGAARNLRKRLARLMDFAVERGWRADNPVRAVRPPRAAGPGFAAWSEADIAVFAAAYAPGTRERLALALLLYTGQRRSDAVAMGRQHVRGETLSVVQHKGRGRAGGPTRLAIPLHPALRAELAASPEGQLTFLLTAYGRAFSRAGFTKWFGGRARAAGLPGLTPHGLRKAAGRRLAEAGCSARQIAAILGHRTLAEVARYTESADQAALAISAMALLEARA